MWLIYWKEKKRAKDKMNRKKKVDQTHLCPPQGKSIIYQFLDKTIANCLCGHCKSPSSFSNTIGSVSTLLFVITSAHTLLGPVVLMLRLVDHTLCLDQLYSCTAIMLSSLCTPVRHFVVTSANNLFGLVCFTTWHYIHTFVVHTLCLDQLYCCTFILKSSLCSLGDCVHNCTVHLYTR